MIRWACVLLIYIIGFAGAAQAHEVRPSYLHLNEVSPAQFEVVWKQPVLEGKRLRIKPVFEADCEEVGPRDIRANGRTATESFTLRCPLLSGEIRLEGLERTLTDAFVRIDYLDGSEKSGVIKADNPAFNLSEASAARASAYIKIGLDHIIFGWDHLLFVIGLVMLVTRRQIIGVATAFTVAHSLTLALAAFGLLTLPTRPVEILIAMSIVLLALEIVRKNRGQSSLAIRKPYLISFVIGLIHGCGFASALSEIGLPKGTELLALLFFNIGVEIGQIGVILGLLVAIWALLKSKWIGQGQIEYAAAYGIGITGMFWAVQRLAEYAA
jgi:hypothetical protein